MSKSNTSVSGVAPTRRGGFPDEFKQDAVRLVVDEKYSFKAAAEAVGVSANSLRVWHKKFAPPPKACGSNATLDELREVSCPMSGGQSYRCAQRAWRDNCQPNDSRRNELPFKEGMLSQPPATVHDPCQCVQIQSRPTRRVRTGAHRALRLWERAES